MAFTATDLIDFEQMSRDMDPRTNAQMHDDLEAYVNHERSLAVVRMWERLDSLKETIVTIHHRVPVNAALVLNEDFEAAMNEIASCVALLKVIE